MKTKRMIKKINTLVLAILLICNYSNAAVVADNDGSAFITKAEFDSLKNSFQSQLDQYNSSIDSKIDSAIAGYLAGIKVEKKITEKDLLTPLSKIYYFDKNYKIPPTKIGDYGKFWGKIAVLLDRTNGGDGNNVCNMEYNGGTIARDNTQWVTVGSSTNKSTFYMFLKDDTYPGKVDTAYVMESQPFTMYSITGAHSAWSQCNNVTGIKKPSNWNGTKGTLTEWGSWATSVAVDAWSGVTSVYNMAYASITVSSVDSTETTWDKNSLPGGVAFTDRQLHSIELKNLNNIGNARSTRYDMSMQCTQGPHVSYRKNISSAMQGGTQATSHQSWLGFILYDHQYVDTYYTRDINLLDISSVVSSFTTYGDGLPIFKSSQDGKVKFVLNTGALIGTWDNPGFEISRYKFGNRDINSNPFWTLPTTAEYKITEKGTPGLNNKYEIEFDVEKNTIYWISAKPTTNDKVYLKIEGDIVNTAKQ